MRPEHQTEYIVQALRVEGAMYEHDARAFLAEHDARVRAEVLAEVEARLAAMTDEADQYTAELENEGVDSSSTMYAQHIGLRRARDEVRRMAGGEKATAEAATATPDFFQPGRTYTDGNGYRAPELVSYFRVEHVTRHPDRGHLRAIGWIRSGAPDSGWHGDFRDEGEFEGWTAVTEGGDGRG
jgi:hypothetical protein